jgi:DNA-binding response OmpR family regulator
MSSPLRDDGGVRVLVVEDHPVLVQHIAEGLRDQGMAVDLALDGAQALDKVRVGSYDVVVLDRDLPQVHGDDVCRGLLGRNPRPHILMLTASGEVEDRVDGLNLGADDYLTKPFAFAELVARINALARRPPALPPAVVCGDILLDRARHRVTRNGAALALNRKEFAVLDVLVSADGAVVSAEELLERVWDEHTDPMSNIVSVTVARLRRKLGEPPLIETIVGRGYRL